MSFTDVSSPVQKPVATGISLGVLKSKSSHTARMTFTATAQQEIFGGSIAGQHFSAQIGRGTDEGKLLLRQDERGGLVATASVKGSVFIRMKAWDLLPEKKVPAEPCELQDTRQDGLLFKLPSWTRPSRPGGKLDQEHGRKRSGGGAL